MGPSRSFWNGTTSALQPEEITSKGTSFMCVLSIKVSIRKKKSGNLFNDPCKTLPPPPSKCPGYDIKPSDCEAPALEFWRMWSIPSLPLLPGSL